MKTGDQSHLKYAKYRVSSQVNYSRPVGNTIVINVYVLNFNLILIYI